MRSLRYLLAVSRERSFTGAAVSLQVSQPALSQAIARTEQLVGGRLVLRDARGVAREGSALTPAGQALVADATRITELLDRALVRARRIAEEGERERLAVGIGTSTPRWVSTRLVQASQESPDLDVVLRHVPWGREVASLADGRVDVVFLNAGPDEVLDARVRAVHVADTQRVAVFAAGHRLAGETSIDIADLDDEPIVDAGYDREVWLVEPRPSGAVPRVVGPPAAERRGDARPRRLRTGDGHHRGGRRRRATAPTTSPSCRCGGWTRCGSCCWRSPTTNGRRWRTCWPRSRGPPVRGGGAHTEKEYSVVVVNSAPGRSTESPSSGWFTASGSSCVSRQSASPWRTGRPWIVRHAPVRKFPV